jgi:hypothetical protein
MNFNSHMEMELALIGDPGAAGATRCRASQKGQKSGSECEMKNKQFYTNTL